MPVVGTPATPFIITRDQVRMFIRDRADKNILLDDVQFTDTELNGAIEMTVSNFNAITPVSSFVAMNFPNMYVLLIGTARYLMRSETFLQARNQASYQDGDIAPIGIDDKAALFSQIAQELKAEWDELTRGMKTQANMEGAYKTLGSGYRSVSRYHQ